MTVCVDADDSVSVKRAVDVPLFPSATDKSLMLTVGLPALAAAGGVALAGTREVPARSGASRPAMAPPAAPVAKTPGENTDQQTINNHNARERREELRDMRGP